MADYINDNETPVFLINGFLDSGKTAFINYTLGEDYFHIDGKTLLIVTEEGEVSYDRELLKREKTVLVSIDDIEELNSKRLKELQQSIGAERVVIELNGMWDSSKITFPKDWVVYQQITVMDGSTLSMYLSNMKALMGPMMKNTELCLVNRCDDVEDGMLLEFKRKLRPMLPDGSDIVFEDSTGEIQMEILDEDLPYDVSGDTIKIPDEYYGLFFIDARDYPQRYIGKTVEFTAQIMKSDRFEKNVFVPGRMVMTCCENDMQFLGYIAKYKDIDAFREEEWVKVSAVFEMKNRKEYGGEGPFLNVKSLIKTGPVNGPAGF